MLFCFVFITLCRATQLGEMSRLADPMTDLVVKDTANLHQTETNANLLYFYLAVSALGIKRRARPQTLCPEAKAAPGKSCIQTIHQINAKRPQHGHAPLVNPKLGLRYRRGKAE